MKVYVVTSGPYDDNRVYTATTDFDKAQRIAVLCSSGVNQAEVEECDDVIYDVALEHYGKDSLWEYFSTEEDNEDYCEKIESPVASQYTLADKVIVFMNAIKMYVFAPDREQAIAKAHRLIEERANREIGKERQENV